MNTNTILFCLSDAGVGKCLNCPHYMSLNTSISDCRAQRIAEARQIVEKYQRIQDAYETWLADGRMGVHEYLSKITDAILGEEE